MDFQTVKEGFVKVSFTAREHETLLGDFLASMRSMELSPTGKFLTSVLSEPKRNRVGGTEITLGTTGVQDLLKDMDLGIKYKSSTSKFLFSILSYHHHEGQ